jgi:hypothetical protein
MAKKAVLIEAVRKLEILNQELREKLGKNSKQKLAESYRQQIARNEAMILDYKYRIEHE